MLKINNLINSGGEYEPASFNEPHLFSTLPALDEEKERPMTFLLRARKPGYPPARRWPGGHPLGFQAGAAAGNH
ncbi:hypothetical protein FD820_36240, partial [Klebsiella pneumoniae]|nr:hypothetical protein [Klebsiella pneumoniae]